MENNFAHPQQLRYFTLQDRNPEDCNHLVIALHGYGQLAAYFIQKFKSLSPTLFVLAPEGPHRFYLEGSSGRVGASWMTKEARELDIENNLAWLNALMLDFTSKHSFDKISLLGFFTRRRDGCKVDTVISANVPQPNSMGRCIPP
ncbi:MAG: hypothetical protein EBQ66_02935 [Flavobacteriia bacterium]|nr:hypothetical protein [Flavobacteriia bacterium]